MTDRLQRLTKKKLDIDYSKLQVARVWDDDEELSIKVERKRLEKAYKDAVKESYKAERELLDFYILYGVGK